MMTSIVVVEKSSLRNISLNNIELLHFWNSRYKSYPSATQSRVCANMELCEMRRRVLAGKLSKRQAFEGFRCLTRHDNPVSAFML